MSMHNLDPLLGDTPVDSVLVGGMSNVAAPTTNATTTSSESKWTKNGFGSGVKRQGSGKFTKAESDLVRAAVKDYCRARNIAIARLCSECDHKAELKGAWMEIAKKLPHRSIQSVYRHGLRILHPFKRGVWSDEECQFLLQMVTRVGKKWSTIQTKLNRSADSCRDKYREMNDDYVKGRWKEEETVLFKSLIREFLRVTPEVDFKEMGDMVQQQGIAIPWGVISKRMGNRSRLSCFKKWQKLVRLGSSQADGEEDNDAAAAAASATAATTTKDTTTTDSTTGGKRKKGQGPKNGKRAKTSTPSRARDKSEVESPSTTASPPFKDNTPSFDLPATTSASSLVNTTTDSDIYLLSELASLGAIRPDDVDWDLLRVDRARERWDVLIQEWQEQEGFEATDDIMTESTFSELAQLLMERKTSAAKMAAETVEAVGIPTLQTQV